MTNIVAEGRAWAKQLSELYAAGASDAEVAAELKITIKEFYKQVGDNKSFATLVEYGRTLSQAFWEGQVRKNLTNKQFNTPLWAFYMKNKFGWADKTESVNSNENVNTDLDSLRTQVYGQIAKLIKENTPELTDAQRIFTQLGQDKTDE